MEKNLLLLGLLGMAYNVFYTLRLRRDFSWGEAGRGSKEVVGLILPLTPVYLVVLVLTWNEPSSPPLFLLSLVLLLGTIFVHMILHLIATLLGNLLILASLYEAISQTEEEGLKS